LYNTLHHVIVEETGALKCSKILAAALLLTAIPAIAQAKSTDQSKTQIIQGTRIASEASKSNKSIIYVPFTVPAGTTWFNIEFGVDLRPEFRKKFTTYTAVFDPRGNDFGGAGFRGYQVSSWPTSLNSEITITGDPKTTTQFYIPGPIYPGKWTIMQMLLKCPKKEFHYKYTITFHFDGSVPPTAAPMPPIANQEILDPAAGWYPGDVHFHSLRSDGNKELAETVDTHEREGYRFLITTDHNTCRAHYDIADIVKDHPKMLMICGQEWTTFGGHANILGMKPGSWDDFRVDPGDGNLPKILDEVNKQGAIFSIDHPFAPKFLWLYPENEWAKADAIEVWNGGWSADDQQSLDLWDNLLRRGRRVAAFGGSDNHSGVGPIIPAIWVYSRNLSQEAIMDGLRGEHVFISENAKGPKLILSTDEGRIIPGDIVHINNQALPIDVHVTGGKGMTLRLIWSGSEEKISIPSDDIDIARTLDIHPADKKSYIRAELIKPDGKMTALTNAIYIEK
jgi:hypothetical protein